MAGAVEADEADEVVVKEGLAEGAGGGANGAAALGFEAARDDDTDADGVALEGPVCIGVKPPTGVGALETAGDTSAATARRPLEALDEPRPRPAKSSSAKPNGSFATGFSPPPPVFVWPTSVAKSISPPAPMPVTPPAPAIPVMAEPPLVV